MIEADCKKCGEEIEGRGAILYGTPITGREFGAEEYSKKTHLCDECYQAVMEYIEEKGNGSVS